MKAEKESKEKKQQQQQESKKDYRQLVGTLFRK